MQSSLSIDSSRLDLSQKLSPNNSVELLSSSYKKQQQQQYHHHRSPSLVANLLYKLTELAAHTSTVATEAYQAFIVENRPDNYHIDNDDDNNDDDVSESMPFDYDEDYDDYDDLQIGFSDEDEEEPPPPYETTWSMV